MHYRARDLFSNDVDLEQYAEYYKTYPRKLHLKKANYDLSYNTDRKGHFTVTVKANNYLRDVMLQTEPHIDGHFNYNFFDLGKGATLTATFIPRDPNADLSGVKVTLKCLNDIYHK